MVIATLNYLTTIQFGEGAASKIAGWLEPLDVSRPLVVTDKGLRACGVLDQVLAGLPPDLTIFDETPSNPTEAAIEAAADLYRSGKCDGVLAIGGGSPIDLGKAVALRVTHEGPLYRFAVIEGGLERITPDVAPVIAVPTTSGTGAEVGRAALVTVADGRKLAIISPHCIPKLAVCDPELTYGLPSGLTAATGMDALTHCIETYLSPRSNPPAEAIALDGMERAWHNIEQATDSGSDIGARREMMMASLEGGLTFQKGLGAVHSMSHPLGSLSQVNPHHGTLNAVILPHVLAYNEGHTGQKYDHIRERLGLAGNADLAQAISDLNTRLRLPATLGEMGIGEEVFDRMSDAAVQDHSTATNPRPVSRDEFRDLFRACA